MFLPDRFDGVDGPILHRTECLTAGEGDGRGSPLHDLPQLRLHQGLERAICPLAVADLAQTLIRHRLVDEFRLTVFPVFLGTGKRLFDGTAPTGLKLVSSRTTDGGVVASVYRPTGAPAYGSYGL